MNPPTVLNVADVWLRYGDTEVLRGLYLQVRPGESVAITGPSGVGKSSLIRVLAGLEQPNSGVVELLGTNLVTAKQSVRHKIRREMVGLAGQDADLLPELTLYENVELPMLLSGQQPGAAPLDTLELFEIGDLADRYPAEVSGGQRQRAALARALVTGPQLLLADEPTGALDEALTDRLAPRLLSILKDLGTAAVICTHDVKLAARCDSMLRLNRGVLAAADEVT